MAESAGSITVTIASGNPFNDTPAPRADGVLVELGGPQTQRIVRTDAQGTAVFAELPEGSFKVSFPEREDLVAHRVSLPFTDPVTGAQRLTVTVHPKRVPASDSTAPAANTTPDRGPGQQAAPDTTAAAGAPVGAPTASGVAEAGSQNTFDQAKNGLLAITGGRAGLLAATLGALAILGGLLLVVRRRSERNSQ